jgi:hypothetical protein
MSGLLPVRQKAPHRFGALTENLVKSTTDEKDKRDGAKNLFLSSFSHCARQGIPGKRFWLRLESYAMQCSDENM